MEKNNKAEGESPQKGVISFASYLRIRSVIEGHDITESELDYALKNVYIYGVPEIVEGE